jgi:histidinol-phosphate aminotransferase
VLVKFPDADHAASAADAALRARGIALRRFASPAFRDYIRITIGRPDELQQCVAAISAFLKEKA